MFCFKHEFGDYLKFLIVLCLIPITEDKIRIFSQRDNWSMVPSNWKLVPVFHSLGTLQEWFYFDCRVKSHSP